MDYARNPIANFDEIFSRSLYRIPDYQRGYSWGKHQLDDFWSDLINLPKDKKHYTGMLSIQRIPLNIVETMTEEKWILEHQRKAYYVIDGQQRLTTFSIFIQCFIEYMKALDINKDSSLKDINILNDTLSLKDLSDSYILCLNNTGTLRAYLFGYENDNPSFKYLRHCIFNEPDGGEIQESLYTHNLNNAKKFFQEKIKDYVKESSIDALESLFGRLIYDMVFMVHDITDEFDVYSAFETMNNRGKRLSNLELLKSRLIYLSTLLDLNPDEEHHLRNTINDCWKQIYWQLGRNECVLSDDEFLRDHWLIRYQYSGKRGEDYASFLLGEEFVLDKVKNSKSSVEVDIPDTDIPFVDDQLEEDDEETAIVNGDNAHDEGKYIDYHYIESYALSLRSTAQWWYATHCPDDANCITASERLWLRRLNRLGMNYFRPLIVASFISANVSSFERVKLFEEIERFIFIVFRMTDARTSFNRNNTYASARKLASGEISIDDVIANLHNRLEDYYQPSTAFDASSFIDQMNKRFTRGNKDGFYGWSGLRYFLYEYEENCVENYGSPQKLNDFFKKNEHDKVSIEHIYPQSESGSRKLKPSEDWQEMFEKYNDEQKAALGASLGNMLLLSMSINASLQAVSYSDKVKAKTDDNGAVIRRGYRQGSHSENEVAGKYEYWNAEAILDRGMSLLDFMEKRWKMKFASDEDKLALLHIGFVNEVEGKKE